MNEQYLYPQNLKSQAKLWLWNLRDLAIIGTALLVSVFEENGADSFAGRVASVLAGSSETTFYATAMYFGSVNVTKIRHTLLAAVAADLTAMVMSAVTVQLFFG